LSRLVTARRLIVHLVGLLRSGQLRFRLETYGIYYPAIPYAEPWWKIRPRYLWLLLVHLRSYARWVDEMEELRSQGTRGWWSRH